MLYIKFTIEDTVKYKDFLVLFDHMIKVRKPNFEFKDGTEFSVDFENLTDEDLEYLLNPNRHQEKRFSMLVPAYASQFLQLYVGYDKERVGDVVFEVLSIFNYLEVDFEVDFSEEIQQEKDGKKINFSTGSYPFGGLERFLITLKAFGLIAFECNDGFGVHKVEWLSDFTYQFIS